MTSKHLVATLPSTQFRMQTRRTMASASTIAEQIIIQERQTYALFPISDSIGGTVFVILEFAEKIPHFAGCCAHKSNEIPEKPKINLNI